MRVVYNGNPALRNVSLPVLAITEDIRRLAKRMIATMKENDVPGVGLAAPQVGVNSRLIVIDTRPTNSKERRQPRSPGEDMLNPLMPMALVNPEILSSSAECDTACEGCLSLPGVEGEVTRPSRVLLRATDLDGREIMVECGGLLARCLQHEIDHLNGILFYDRLSSVQQKENEAAMADLARVETAMAAVKS